jgi:hypothetical protein
MVAKTTGIVGSANSLAHNGKLKRSGTGKAARYALKK